MTTYATKPERLYLHRDVRPVTPYVEGFEAFRYHHCWRCRYPTGSQEAVEYEQGFQDARKAEREARL